MSSSKKCMSCRYGKKMQFKEVSSRLKQHEQWYCDYLLMHLERRPSEPGDNCTSYEYEKKANRKPLDVQSNNSLWKGKL